MRSCLTGRGLLHSLMMLALFACILSLVESARTHSRPCPVCSGRAEHCQTVRSLSPDRRRWGRAHSVFRCSECEYEVMEFDQRADVRVELANDFLSHDGRTAM